MQVTYGGFLSIFTLHLQAGLGDSALRAGLTYLPMAGTFGLVGFYWRKLGRAGEYPRQSGLTRYGRWSSSRAPWVSSVPLATDASTLSWLADFLPKPV
jgi:hypothetical protein